MQEQTMFVGDAPAVLVSVISGGQHVAANFNTTTTRVDGNSAAPNITTVGTGNYKISFPGLSPAPVEGDELLVRVNGDISGTAWSEAVFKLKVLPQIITSKLDTIESTAEDTLFACENDIPQSIFNLPSASDIQTACNSALVALHLDHLFAAEYDAQSKPGTASALFNELVVSQSGVSVINKVIEVDTVINPVSGGGSGGSGGGGTSYATSDIQSAALEPKSAEADGVKMEARTIEEMIEADQYARKTEAGKKRLGGIRLTGTRGGGSTGGT